MDRLAGHVRPTPRKLTVVFRSVRPDASLDELRSFSPPAVARGVEETGAELYAKYAPEKFSLDDRGYLADVHPLELWLVAYLQQHPGATRSQVLAASADARQEVYAWLFKTSNAHKQDVRIRILFEEDAFDRFSRTGSGKAIPSAISCRRSRRPSAARATGPTHSPR